MVQGYERLTEREKQTLRLLLVGHDAKSMARHFGLSVHTINERLRDARRKLSVSSSKEAARLLRDMEGVSPETSADTRLGAAYPAPVGEPDTQPHPAPRLLRRARWVIGALAMLSLFAAALAMFASHSALPEASEAALPPETEASRAARDWLALVDAGKWDQSWSAAGHSFKSLNSAEGWRWASVKVRAPLGAVVSRTLIGEEDMPAPPHGYRVVRFRTRFADKTAIETVSLDHERTGWKVVGITER